MVQEVEGGAARARSLLQVPDPQRTEHAFQGVGLEPVVEQLAHRHRQDAQQVDDHLLAESPHAQAQPR